VDTTSYTKVFHQGSAQLLAADLSLPAMKLVIHILANLKPKKDEIKIDLDACLTQCKWKSQSVFNKAVRELIKKSFIYKSDTGKTTYWINANYFFNGDRKGFLEPLLNDN